MGRGAVEKKKRKKKGRPSLLDLQKRSLRLQKQQQKDIPNPNPNNPYLRFPNSSSSSVPRRTTRRNQNDDDEEEEEEEEDDDEEEEDDDNSSGKRKKEKKLKLVLKVAKGSGSESDGEASRKKRKIGGAVETGRQNSSSKVTEHSTPQGGREEPSDLGPTTPLPDKKLLGFILDRLQKKDTYSVFSEPVDPNELPDYHDIIENPMDFGTVRKKLAGTAYANLEQFERDVFLICSNAMRYNSPDTIYYRQARSMQEIARKDFENLRQESDDNVPEPKIVRRGRPPGKNTTKRIGRPPGARTSSDFSAEATLANALDGTNWSNPTPDSLRKVSSLDKPSTVDASSRYGLRNSETYTRNSEHRSERSEECSGSLPKMATIRNWKKNSNIDENRRNSYYQPQLSTCAKEVSVLTGFSGEKKLLLPVGIHMEHAYVKSLARFAANLGPVGWQIAAKRIERILPPGTKFGPGWVGDSEAPQQSQLSILGTSSPQPSSQPKTPSTIISRGDKKLLENHELTPTVEEASNSSALPPSASPSAATTPSRSSDSGDCVAGSRRGSNNEGGSHIMSDRMQPKTPFQFHQNMTMQPCMNGGFGFSFPTQAGKMLDLPRPPGSLGSEVAVSHAWVLDMVSRSGSNNFMNHQVPIKLEADEVRSMGNPSAINLGSSKLLEFSHDLQGQPGEPLLNPKPESVPPDLNVGFQSPGSPVSGVLTDSSQQQQQPDLALQL